MFVVEVFAPNGVSPLIRHLFRNRLDAENYAEKARNHPLGIKYRAKVRQAEYGDSNFNRTAGD